MDRFSTLKLFVSAVDQASISGAGRLYGLSTTSASRRLQDLEASLGVRLLDRTTRSVTPTEAGQALYERISPLLPGIDAALREAGESGDEPVGTLHVLARRSFGMMHVAPRLAAFLEAYPKLRVDLELTERVDIAPGRGVDIAIRLGAPTEKSLHAVPLATGRRVLCASPGYLARRGAPRDIGDLADHACLIYRRAHEPATWVFEARDGGTRRDVAVAGPLSATNGEVLREAAIAGAGLVLLPVWMIAPALRDGRLVECLPSYRAYPAGYESEIFAVHRRMEPLPAKIAAFMTHLLQNDAEGESGTVP